MRKSILPNVVHNRNRNKYVFIPGRKTTTDQRYDITTTWCMNILIAMVYRSTGEGLPESAAFHHLSHYRSFPFMTDYIPWMWTRMSFLFKFILLSYLDIAVRKLTNKCGICETFMYFKWKINAMQNGIFFSLLLPLYLYPFIIYIFI